jgi:HTH-like domain
MYRSGGRVECFRSARPGQAPLEQRIREICQTRIRYGYRRVHVLLRRDGWRINQKKTRRIYRELGLQLRNKTPKRRVKAKLRDDRRKATRPNETWAMDFVHDQLATGTKLRVLTIVDTYSRFSPALEPRPIRLNPLDPRVFLTQSAMAFAHFIAERDDEAARWAAMALRIKPNWLPALRMMIASNAMRGHTEEAKRALNAYLAIDPGVTITKLCEYYPFRREADRQRLIAGMRKGGVAQR